MKTKMVYRGEKVELNPVLLRSQRLKAKKVKKILNLHKKRIDLFKKMEKLDPSADNQKLRKLAAKCDKIDKNLQKAWGFSEDPSYLTWWFRVPHCTCDVALNFRYLGEHRIMKVDCPIHFASDSIKLRWNKGPFIE